MKIAFITSLTLCALIPALAGCAASGSPADAGRLSATECRDLIALRDHAPPTPERKRSELTALRKAGYDPSKWYDPYYPDDLQMAQRRIARWLQTDCQQQPG
ncbi:MULTISPECIES: DUF4148 domain-containing protein [unclassified Caballeronia]|uniref:DUF4148 domain-containing protein n=1 Tax=unclassified Caballeronia TaxID=2646786 RepID=UPI00285C2167|nr:MULTISPECIES: DUF4148 domain-containing protein [unclassified Caballeronia]MDR5740779.1 DUF4148 domain-containing protein [Caballeronia sp. LZ016]MDR5808700.1 DUF4148 domain-containing protein [Caballeronia sp. LZ019]